jgi:hypothetical protein
MEGEEEEKKERRKKEKLKWDSQSNYPEFSLLCYNQYGFTGPKT